MTIIDKDYQGIKIRWWKEWKTTIIETHKNLPEIY